jgi:single-stranded-DNA-specific exonuclease
LSINTRTTTRITTRPCPFRASEMLRQGGVHPVLARIYAARGLLDVRELSSALAALVPAAGEPGTRAGSPS